MSEETEFWNLWQEHRASIVIELQRELSKTGSLESYRSALSFISRRLSVEDIVTLYQELRRSNRPEFEWRNEFLKIFPLVNDTSLPEPLLSRDDALKMRDEVEHLSNLNQPQTGYPDIPF